MEPPPPRCPPQQNKTQNKTEKQNKTRVQKHIVLPLRLMSTDATQTAGLCNLHFIIFSQGLSTPSSTCKASVLFIYFFYQMSKHPIWAIKRHRADHSAALVTSAQSRLTPRTRNTLIHIRFQTGKAEVQEGGLGFLARWTSQRLQAA